MEYEIELKLLTNESAGKVIEEKLLPTLKGQISKKVTTLINHYFDTPSRMLRNYDIGLRIRANDEYCEQTLKTSGQSLGGLHKRPEYNVPLDLSTLERISVPNLRLFDGAAWPADFDVNIAQDEMETLFSTNFVRHIYLLESDTSTIEIVWDKGEVIGGGKAVPICEIEIELKKGLLNDVFVVAKQLASFMPILIGIDSKAARGYRLADNMPGAKNKLSLPQAFNGASLGITECTLVINQTLSHFQRYAMLLSAAEIDVNDVAEISKSLDMLNIAIERLLSLTSCKGIFDLLDSLKSLMSSWSSIESNFEQQDNQYKQYGDFFSHADTVCFQLMLVQVLIEKPWEGA